ncbi:hypothetical protein H6P81_017971 [Aristolochia fimbriata]|uniref:Cation/H+ exchanger domain-containing protein n=1 Tax=Aristolochia fimbriata TaxID=158543 RepID=A0AAV7E041_ARIFI|nr:hypothetical protein H6P81_017971 [Aristolochia fimbriata]
MDGDDCLEQSNEILGDNGEIVLSTFLQGCVFLVVGRCLHYLLLRRLGQARVVSQLLAGVILGPAMWSADGVSNFFFPKDPERFLTVVGDVGGVLFVFLIGIEADIPYMWRTRRAAAEIAAGSILTCAATAAVITPTFRRHMGDPTITNPIKTWLFLAAVLANTTTPVVIDLCADMGLAASELGRLAVSSAIFNDIACLAVLIVASSTTGPPGVNHFMFMVIELPILFVILTGFRSAVRMLGKLHRQNTGLNMMEMLLILAYLMVGATFASQMGFSPMISAFVMGVTFPRDEAIRRTLVQRLMGIVHVVVFPVYFGYTGVQMRFSILRETKGVVVVVVFFAFSTLCKIAGTLIVTTYRNIPLSDGFVMGLILNTKAHLHVVIASFALEAGFWGLKTQRAMLIGMVLCTVISRLGAVFIRRGRQVAGSTQVGLEHNPAERDIQMVLCVYAVRHAPAMMNLIAYSPGAEGSTLRAHVVHLIELTQKNTTALLYHQRPIFEDHHHTHGDGNGDGDGVNGEDARQIAKAIGVFTGNDRLTVHPLTVCSEFENMHVDVCREAVETSASLIVLPFHKHRRVDGRMETTQEGYRIANQRILENARCSVGILVDRGFGEIGRTSPGESGWTHEMVVLFFGGPDDREALAYAGRIAEHSSVSLSLVRFTGATTSESHGGGGGGGRALSMSSDEEHKEVTMSISPDVTEKEVDDEFLANFFARYVATGKVSYADKYAATGEDVEEELRSMEGFCSLLIVGKGNHPLTHGINSRPECPELGRVGDLLASSEFSNHGSVLVVQQYRTTDKNK